MLFLLHCAAHAGPTQFAAELSVVKLSFMEFGGQPGTGSGVVVAQDTVLTACHVTKDAVLVRVVTAQQTAAASEQWRDVVHDLCLLKVPGLTAPPVKIGRANLLQEGVPIAAIGYPEGGGLTLRTGTVERLYQFDDAKIVQCATPFQYGDSGGGVFNEQGELVAVMTFVLGSVNPASFAMPVDWILSRIERQDGYSRIAPGAPGRPFFIATHAAALPYFLRAVRYQRAKKWDEMLLLTAEWTAHEPANADAWLAQGSAYDELGDRDSARHAFQQALALDGARAPADLRLTLVNAGSGQAEESQREWNRLREPAAEPPPGTDRD